jgi:hypothetical protein
MGQHLRLTAPQTHIKRKAVVNNGLISHALRPIAMRLTFNRKTFLSFESIKFAYTKLLCTVRPVVHYHETATASLSNRVA